MVKQIDIIKPHKIFPNQNLVCLRTMVHDDPGSLSTYLKVGGYEQLKKILRNKPTVKSKYISLISHKF